MRTFDVSHDTGRRFIINYPCSYKYCNTDEAHDLKRYLTTQRDGWNETETLVYASYTSRMFQYLTIIICERFYDQLEIDLKTSHNLEAGEEKYLKMRTL